MKRTVITFAALAVALGPSGVAAQEPRVEVRRAVREIVNVVSARHTDQNRDFRVEQVDKQTRTIALGPTGSLDLKNISGDIIVTAGGGREVTLDIVKTSRGRTEADAKLGLDRVTVEIDHSGERASVATRYPNVDRRPPYSVSVAYTITAPAGTRVNLVNISGGVTVKGLKSEVIVDVTSGKVDIANVSGPVWSKTISGNVTISDVSHDGNLTVDAVSGDVLLDRIKARRLTATVTSGAVIARDITVDSASLKVMSGTVEYAGPLSRNGRYELSTHSGNVRAIIAGTTGFELDASTFSGRIDPDVQIKTVTTKSQKTVRATVGDGSARLVATTFSGNISISRKGS